LQGQQPYAPNPAQYSPMQGQQPNPPNPAQPAQYGQQTHATNPAQDHQNSASSQPASNPMLLSAEQVDKSVQQIYNALKGMGAKEDVLCEVFGGKTSMQVQQIRQGFKAAYGKDLQVQLEKETGGSFGHLLAGISRPLAEFDAMVVYQAIRCVGNDEAMITEVIGARNNTELRAIREAYWEIYQKDAEKEIENEVDSKLRGLIIGQLQGQRDESEQIMNIDRDVEDLYNSGQGKWGTNEGTFFAILNTRSYNHLRTVFQTYSQRHGKTIEDVIESEFNGDLKRLLLVTGTLFLN
jgi:annexin A7/11